MSSPSRIPSERGIVDTLLYYLSLLKPYRWFIIGLTAGVTLLVAAYCLVSVKLPPEKSPMPNTYRAQAVLLIQRQEGNDLAASIMSALGAEPRGGNGSAGFDTGALVLRVLGSRSLLDKVVADFDLSNRWHITQGVRGRTREVLHARLRTLYDISTGAVTISFEDADPVFARDIVNHVVALLDEWFSQNRGTAKVKQMQLLEVKVNEVKASVAGLEYQLKQLQNRYGVLTAQDLGASQASSLANLRSQLILKEIEIKNYSSFSLVDDTRLQQLTDEKKNILDLINQLQVSAPGTSAEPGTPSESDRTIADVAQQFSRLSNELDIQRRIYNLLSPQYEAAKLTKESEPVFQVLELAEAPDVKIGPARSRIVATAFAGALAGSIVLSYLVIALRKSFKKARSTPA
jgi:tyrosine-protein kinase Etk/Wzc